MPNKTFTLRNVLLMAGEVILPTTALLALWAGRPRAASVASIVSTATTLVPTLWRNHSFFGPTFTGFKTSRRWIWLTIDDGPYPDETREMLEVLAQFRAVATFFLIGKEVEKHPECVSQILAAGHTIGNHTQNHPVSRFWALPACAIQKEIHDCSESLVFAGAPLPRWFRSPVGMTNPNVHPILARKQLKLIGWHAGSMDGFISTESYWQRRVLPRLRPGAILLLHQLRQGGGAQTLRFLLKKLHQLGYSCVLPEESTFF